MRLAKARRVISRRLKPRIPEFVEMAQFEALAPIPGADAPCPTLASGSLASSGAGTAVGTSRFVSASLAACRAAPSAAPAWPVARIPPSLHFPAPSAAPRTPASTGQTATCNFAAGRQCCRQESRSAVVDSGSGDDRNQRLGVARPFDEDQFGPHFLQPGAQATPPLVASGGAPERGRTSRRLILQWTGEPPCRTLSIHRYGPSRQSPHTRGAPSRRRRLPWTTRRPAHEPNQIH